MSKREECRACGAKLKHDKTSDQYDPEYCSGKCRKLDGAEPYVKTAEEQAAVVAVASKTRPATLEDYKKNVPAKYARRFEPEKLNWSKNRMNEDELKQAGFRANREPIPGDWDYEAVEKEIYEDILDAAKDVIDRQPTEYELLKEKAKALDIKIFGKTKDVLAKEVEEAENEA
jgi:hypothetical protein